MKSILHNVLRMEADIAESERIAVAMIAADIEEYKIIIMDAVMPTRVSTSIYCVSLVVVAVVVVVEIIVAAVVVVVLLLLLLDSIIISSGSSSNIGGVGGSSSFCFSIWFLNNSLRTMYRLVEWRGGCQLDSPKGVPVFDRRGHRERQGQPGDGLPLCRSGYDHHEADECEAAEAALWIHPEIRGGNPT